MGLSREQLPSGRPAQHEGGDQCVTPADQDVQVLGGAAIAFASETTRRARASKAPPADLCAEAQLCAGAPIPLSSSVPMDLSPTSAVEGVGYR
jgi:hypothetical protein